MQRTLFYFLEMITLKYFPFLYFLPFFAISTIIASQSSTMGDKIIISPHDLSMEFGENGNFDIYLSEQPGEDLIILLAIDHSNVLLLDPYLIFFNNETWHSNVTVIGINPGKIVVNVDYYNGTFNYSSNDAYIRINIKLHDYLDVISDTFGWIYFVCWTSTLYPQIYLNFRRKSAIGFAFEYIFLNLLGTFSYSVYNIGVYFSPLVKGEYFELHPYGIMPIQPQDIAYAVLSFFWTAVCGAQGFYYTHDSITLSKFWMSLFFLGILFLIISTIIAGCAVISWLDCLYYFSYLKLGIITIKYFPQVISNYRKKSTSGYSVGFPILDFTGGSLSIMQMFLMAYNYDDWSSIFGNPTKLLLGLVSMFFDTCFLVQHFILYRNSPVSKRSSINSSVNKSLSIDDKNDSIKKLEIYFNIASALIFKLI